MSHNAPGKRHLFFNSWPLILNSIHFSLKEISCYNPDDITIVPFTHALYLCMCDWCERGGKTVRKKSDIYVMRKRSHAARRGGVKGDNGIIKVIENRFHIESKSLKHLMVIVRNQGTVKSTPELSAALHCGDRRFKMQHLTRHASKKAPPWCHQGAPLKCRV